MHLLAFIDGSPYSASVCDHAAWAATRAQASVELLHVLGRRETPSTPTDLSGSLNLGARSELLADLTRADTDRARLAHARGRMILDDAAARLTSAGVEGVETRLRNDDFLVTVREFEPTADLLVIGKRGAAAELAHDHLGSNLERALRSATRPILVASRAFRPIQRLLVAFDGSRSAARALDLLAANPVYAGLACTLLHIGEDTPHLRADMEDVLQPLATGGRRLDIEIVQGDAETVITHTVERLGIDLLVMGAHGHSRIRALIIGSTTTAVLHACKVPVLMVR